MNLQRFALTCSAGVLAFSSAAAESGNPNVHLEEALRDLKSKEGEIRSQWEKDEDGFRKLPARAWPAYQPDAEKMESLQGELVACQDTLDPKCQDAKFNLASCLVFNSLDPEKGLEMYTQLSELGYEEGTVGAGVLLVEGLGVEINEKKGLKYLEKAVRSGSAQGNYEYATALYVGLEGSLESNEPESLKHFEMAAKKGHVGGMFMVADSLLERMPELDKSEVHKCVELMYSSAESGHRFARQKIRELLERTK